MFTRNRLPTVVCAALLLISAFQTRADVRLPALFSDDAVLQQGMRTPVWGWADEGEKVTVTFRGKSVSTTCKQGRWIVHLAKLKPGGPDTLTVEGRNRIEIKDVLVGEVWICSGQSNMEWPLNKSKDSAADIAASANPQLRLFHVPKLKSNTPRDDVTAKWQPAAPDTVPGFSAVAYYFGRELQKARHVPIGLIETCWGGSPAEVWMSEGVLKANPEYQRDILDASKAAYAKYEAANPKPNSPPWKPAELYNGMIAPLIPYGIRGAIWYQGESNAPRAAQYRTLFPDMINNWRHDWGQGDFPFFAVVLAPWDMNRKRTLEAITQSPGDSSWAELREAQVLATRVLPNVGLAVITDVGDKDDIHPTRKIPVGERLALAARRIALGEKIEYSGPAFKSMRIKGDRAILSFEHAQSGLESRGGALQGFAIAGEDRKFFWAEARIEGKMVVVQSPQVPKPVAVRYGWADFPVVNLWNGAGLPAVPFRTDDWPLTTASAGAKK